MQKSKKEGSKKGSEERPKDKIIVNPVKKKGIKDSTVAIIIIAAILIIILILGGLMALLFYYPVSGPQRDITADTNIGQAFVEKERAYVKLSDSVNLDDVKTIEFIFYDEEGNQYLYSASSVNLEYEILPEEIGVENFDDIVSVSTLIDYEEEPAPTTPPDQTTTRPPAYTPPSTGGNGGTDGNNDEGCEDECDSEGLFCDGNSVYNCSEGEEGCFELNRAYNCLKGELCSAGKCVPGPCSVDANCSSDGCYSGEYRDYYCNSSNYCAHNVQTKTENLTNGNCNDSKDNDCNGLIDEDDSGCSGQSVCGNNVRELEEVCDGTNINKTCSDFGYTEGNISCCNNCENFDLSACYNITYGYCFDGDNGKDYHVFSNVSQAVSFDHGEPCSNATGGGGGGGGVGIILDKCNGSILSEGTCNATTGRPQIVDYDCNIESRECIGGRCVYPTACGNELCEVGEQKKLFVGANETVTYSYAGNDYEVELITTLSSTSAIMKVNSLQKEVAEGNTYTTDGLPIYVINVVHPAFVGDERSVTLFLGEDNRTCNEDCEGLCTDTCFSLGYECGNWTICGALRNCGICGIGKQCVSGKCENESCEDECSQEGLFCEGNLAYNCTKKSDGCFDRTNITECKTGYQCVSGICEIIPDCNDNSDCVSLNNVCSIGLCNATGKCEIVYKSTNNICRASAGECDIAEYCSGNSVTCPSNVFKQEGTACTGGTCSGGVCTGCTPNCIGKQCGDNGCGGSCGICGIGKQCVTGICVSGCGDGKCEGGEQMKISAETNETTNYNYSGRLYVTYLITTNSPTSAVISVNNLSREVAEGNTYTIDGLPVYIIDVIHPAYHGAEQSITLFLGEDNRTCPQDCGSLPSLSLIRRIIDWIFDIF